MTKPDKPIEAQGLGCGLIVSIVVVTIALAVFGVPPGPAMIIAMVLAATSLIVYMVNQFKAQRILDHTYDAVKKRERVTPPPVAQKGLQGDGVGMYRVEGVDRESGMDTTWHTHASNAANAKVKGELQGIIVTQVTKAE